MQDRASDRGLSMWNEMELQTLRMDLETGQRWLEKLLDTPNELNPDDRSVAENLLEAAQETYGVGTPKEMRQVADAVRRFRQQLNSQSPDAEDQDVQSRPATDDAEHEDPDGRVLELDGMKVQVPVIYRKGRPDTTVRPWLTVTVDAGSGRVASFVLSAVRPDPVTASACVSRALRGDNGRRPVLPGTILHPPRSQLVGKGLCGFLAGQGWTAQSWEQTEGRGGLAVEQFFATIHGGLFTRLHDPQYAPGEGTPPITYQELEVLTGAFIRRSYHQEPAVELVEAGDAAWGAGSRERLPGVHRLRLPA